MTTVVVNSNWRQYVDTDETAKILVGCYWGSQFVQAGLVIFVIFVPYY